MGRIGAYISHLFFYKGFGLASYFFCTFFFIMGVNLLFGKKIYSPWRNFRYVIVGLIFFSTALAFITSGSAFPGEERSVILQATGSAVCSAMWTTALLIAGGFAYFIWRFNPTFTFPAKKPKAIPQDGNGKIVPVDNSFSEEAKLFADEEIVPKTKGRNKGNNLKHHGGVVVISPDKVDADEENDSNGTA